MVTEVLETKYDEKALQGNKEDVCQPATGTGYSGGVATEEACLYARGTEELIPEEVSVDEVSMEALEVMDPNGLIIPVKSVKEYMGMSKPQLATFAYQAVVRSNAIARDYSLLAERARRDANLKFVNSNDRLKNLIPTKKVAADAAPGDNTDLGDHDDISGNGYVGNGHKGRNSTPKKGAGQQKKWKEIVTLKADDDFSPEEKEKLLQDGYRLVKKEVQRELRTVPSRVYMYERTIYVYKNMKTGEVIRSRYARESKFLPGSMLTAEVLAFIANQYYTECIPVERQIKMYNQENCPLTKQEVYKWLRDYGESAIRPIARRMLQLLLLRKALQSDETYFKSIEEMLDTGRKYCYFWLVRSSECDKVQPPIAVVTFVKHRSAEELRNILGNYEGMVECDGYSAYPALAKMITTIHIACCLQHVNHYFSNALKALPPKLTSEQIKKNPSYIIKEEIGKIFHEESLIKGKTREERMAKRNGVILEMVTNLFDKIDSYSKDPNFDSRSLFGKAVTYAQNRKEYVLAGVKNPDIPIHNSACERFFIPRSVFRNNSKAFSTNRNAEVAADYFSVSSTCAENNGNPRLYFQFLFERIPALMKEHHKEAEEGKLSFLDAYMPWGEKYKEYELNEFAEAKRFFEMAQKSGKDDKTCSA